jgi:small subunit ribosomal protein S3
MGAGARGIKIRTAGRLGGAEMHRAEVTIRGSIPLQMLKCHIDYGFAQAYCTYGVIGVKVWIYLGEYREKQKEAADGHDA